MSNILFFKSENSSRGGLQVGLEIISVDKVIEGKHANRYGYINGHINHITRMDLEEFQEAFPNEEVAKKMALHLKVSAKIKGHYHPQEKVKSISQKLVKRGTVVKTKAKYPSTLLYLGEVTFTDHNNRVQEGHGYFYYDSTNPTDYTTAGSYVASVRLYKTKKPVSEIIKQDVEVIDSYAYESKGYFGNSTYKLKLKNEK